MLIFILSYLGISVFPAVVESVQVFKEVDEEVRRMNELSKDALQRAYEAKAAVEAQRKQEEEIRESNRIQLNL